MVKEINGSTWDQDVMQSEKPVVVDFWHEQCPWCIKLSPIYEALSEDLEEITMAKINILVSDANTEIANRYGIMTTPTIKIFCRGREVGEIVGFMDKESLRQAISAHLDKSDVCLSQSSPRTSTGEQRQSA